MIPIPPYAGKRVGVFGLARTGLATARALRQSGATVLCWDDNERARDQAAAFGLTLQSLTESMATLDALLLSPGVPLYFPQPLPAVVQAARAAGVPIIGDVQLFAQARPHLPAHRVVGVTGTNGKSTTVALLDHVLRASGRSSVLAGNIGVPLLEETAPPAGGVFVLELSSFQIDLTFTLACDVAVLTNITPDHLDRHGSFENYAAAKERLFQMQTPDAVAVIAQDDDASRAIARRVRARLASVPPVPGQERWPSLQGPHNAQNARCVFAAALALGVAAPDVLTAFETYPGLPHRMERVTELNGVLYINDSKATNPTSTAPALGAYPAIHWIAGGKAKGEDLDACLPYLSNVRAAYLIGEAAPLFERLLADKVPIQISGDLARAVAAARAAAKPGEVVLLSPACASFDQFTSFEDRGALFRKLVQGEP